MTRRTWLTIAVVAGVAAMLAVGALLTRGGTARVDRPGSAASAVPTGSAGASESASAATGTASSAEGSPDVTRVPEAAGIGTTVDDGAKLATVTVPPAETIAVISSGAASDGEQFAVAFRPYGWGPTRPAGRALVVMLTAVQSAGGAGSDLKLEPGTNMMAIVSPVTARSVNVGGVYRGVLILRANGGELVPYLEQVREAG